MKERMFIQVPSVLFLILLLPSSPLSHEAFNWPGKESAEIGSSERTWTAISGGHFTENAGQWDEEVRFALKGAHGTTYLCRDGIVYDLWTDEGGAVIKIAFYSPFRTMPEGMMDLGFYSNYFLGNDPDRWVTEARSFGGVLYEDVWPGTDIRYYLKDGQLKYDVLMGEFSDPAAVRFRAEGHKGLFQVGDGLEIASLGGPSVLDCGPVAFYEDGRETPVHFKVLDDHTYGFDVKKEEGRKLTIDPLLFSTVLGGSQSEIPTDFEMDGDGDLYFYGSTFSRDFPNTTGAYDREANGQYYVFDLYVTKMNRDCSKIIFSTFIGGWTCDMSDDMDIDENEDIYLTGYTYNGEFPTTPGAFQRHQNGGSSLFFVTKLASNGSALVYSTLAGGNGINLGCAITVRNGQACVGGHALGYDFPTHTGPVGGIHGYAVFFILDQNGSNMVDYMIIDGYYGEYFTELALDKNNDVIMAGYTWSPMIPTTPHSVQYRGTNLKNVFIAKYRPFQRRFEFVSEFGADGETTILGLKVDEDNNILFTGSTKTGGKLPYPTTPGAMDTHQNGTLDLFVTKIDNNGTKLLFSSIIGGSSEEAGTGLDLDAAGNLHIVGRATTFSNVPGCGSATSHGGEDAFAMKVNRNCSTVLNLTFIGGNGTDGAIWCGLRDGRELLIGGSKSSPDFPITNKFNLSETEGVFMIGIIMGSRPGETTGLRAFGGDGFISLEWGLPLDDGNGELSYYTIYRGTREDDLESIATTRHDLNYTDMDVIFGVIYHYAVSATNQFGEGPLNGTVSNVSTTLPSPPVNLRAISQIGSITLFFETPEFDGGTPITGYSLYKNRKLMVNLSTYELEVEDPDVGLGIFHEYSATSHNRNGESGPSLTVLVRSKGFPSPPVNLTCRPGPAYIDLRWEEPLDNGALDIETYTLYRRSGGSNRAVLVICGFDTVSYRDTSVEPGVRYYYDVVASSLIGPSAPSAEVSARAYTDPVPPVSIKAVPFREGISLEWSYHQNNTDQKVLGFNIYEGFSPSSMSLLSFSEGNLTSFLHDRLVENQVHYYQVSTVTTFGVSIGSEIVSQRPYIAPNPPNRVGAVPGKWSIDLNWRAPSTLPNPPITGYIVLRKPQGGTFSEIARTSSSIFELMDHDVVRGVMYSYKVIAENSLFSSKPSDEVSAMGQFNPDPPINLRAELSQNRLLLTWDPPEYDGGLPVTSYMIYRTAQGGVPTIIDTLAPGSTIYEDRTLNWGQVQCYQVQCENELGSSPPSETVSIGLPGLPSAPVDLLGKIMDGRVVLTWRPPLADGGSEVLYYNIYRKDGTGAFMLLSNTSDCSRVFIDGSVVVGGAYTYHISAVNGIGEGKPGEDISLEIVPPVKDSDQGLGLLDLSLIGAFLLLCILILTALARRRSKKAQGGVETVWREE